MLGVYILSCGRWGTCGWSSCVWGSCGCHRRFVGQCWHWHGFSDTRSDVWRHHRVWCRCWRGREIWCAIWPPSLIYWILTITMWWIRQHWLVLLLCSDARGQRQRQGIPWRRLRTPRRWRRRWRIHGPYITTRHWLLLEARVVRRIHSTLQVMAIHFLCFIANGHTRSKKHSHLLRYFHPTCYALVTTCRCLT
jgi:hypothetical protein